MIAHRCTGRLRVVASLPYVTCSSYWLRSNVLRADSVQITGQAGLGIGPSVFYNRGSCNVQVGGHISLSLMHPPCLI